MKTTKRDQLVKESKSFVQSSEDKFGVNALNEFEQIIELEDPVDKLANFFAEHFEKFSNDEDIIIRDMFERGSLMKKGQEIEINGIGLDTITGKPFEFKGERATVEIELIWDSVYFNYKDSLWFTTLSHVTKIVDSE